MKKQLYDQGRACWATAVTDLPLAFDFYGALFDWKFKAETDREDYFVAMLNDCAIAGLTQKSTGDKGLWNLSFCSTDLLETSKRVTDAGGSLIGSPQEIGGSGVLATFLDAEGAVFSAWRGNARRGFEEINSKGTFCWAEICSSDILSAERFYSSVFDWKRIDGTHDVMDYSLFQMGQKTVAGGVSMPEELRRRYSTFWEVFFMVEDADNAAECVEALGGKVLITPSEIPEGRFTICSDSCGGAFSLLAPRV